MQILLVVLGLYLFWTVVRLNKENAILKKEYKELLEAAGIIRIADRIGQVLSDGPDDDSCRALKNYYFANNPAKLKRIMEKLLVEELEHELNQGPS